MTTKELREQAIKDGELGYVRGIDRWEMGPYQGYTAASVFSTARSNGWVTIEERRQQAAQAEIDKADMRARTAPALALAARATAAGVPLPKNLGALFNARGRVYQDLLSRVERAEAGRTK